MSDVVGGVDYAKIKGKLEEVWQSGGAGRKALEEELDRILGPMTLEDLPLITTQFAIYKNFTAVLSKGGAGEWDEGNVDNPWVMLDTTYQGATYWRMWYEGRDANNRNGKIGYAESHKVTAHGFTFTKYAGNPIFDDPDVPGGYPNHNTANPKVVKKYTAEGPKYYMAYEQQAWDADWKRKGSVVRFAISSDGLSWTKTGAQLSDFEEGVTWDLGCLWVDREGKFHLIVPRKVEVPEVGRVGPYYHYVSEDFENWTKVGELTMEWEMEGSQEQKRCDDLVVVPMGRYLMGYVVLPHYGAIHVWLVSGPSFDSLQIIGPAFSDPADAIPGVLAHWLHEPCFTVGWDRWGVGGGGISPRVFFADMQHKEIYMGFVLMKPETTVPLVLLDSLAGGAASTINDSTLLPTGEVNKLAVTVQLTYAAGATDGARLHLYAGRDFRYFDTEPYVIHDVTFRAGETVRETVVVNPSSAWMYATIENLDGDHAISDIEITAEVS